MSGTVMAIIACVLVVAASVYLYSTRRKSIPSWTFSYDGMLIEASGEIPYEKAKDFSSRMLFAYLHIWPCLVKAYDLPPGSLPLMDKIIVRAEPWTTDYLDRNGKFRHGKVTGETFLGKPARILVAYDEEGYGAIGYELRNLARNMKSDHPITEWEHFPGDEEAERCITKLNQEQYDGQEE